MTDELVEQAAEIICPQAFRDPDREDDRSTARNRARMVFALRDMANADVVEVLQSAIIRASGDDCTRAEADYYAQTFARCGLMLSLSSPSASRDPLRVAREQGQREGKQAVCQWLRDRSAQCPTPENANVASMLADAFEQSEIPGQSQDPAR